MTPLRGYSHCRHPLGLCKASRPSRAGSTDLTMKLSRAAHARQLKDRPLSRQRFVVRAVLRRFGTAGAGGGPVWDYERKQDEERSSRQCGIDARLSPIFAEWARARSGGNSNQSQKRRSTGALQNAVARSGNQSAFAWRLRRDKSVSQQRSPVAHLLALKLTRMRAAGP